MIEPFLPIAPHMVHQPQVPLAIFGVISLLAALLVTFMPETSNTPLPDTIKVLVTLTIMTFKKITNIGC